MSLESKIALLKDRALMFKAVRAFFEERGIMEVDCPAISSAASIEAHIDLLTLDESKKFLHSSPEYGMKRLLSLGINSIYQLSHVFRAGEIGPLHNPEFTMVEWYRLNISFTAFIEDTLDFIRLFLSALPATWMTYRQALKTYVGIDCFSCSIDELKKCAQEKNITVSQDSDHWDKDTWLQLLMGFLVEPLLGQDSLCVLYHYPASQAALSQIEGEVARRFEIYYKGIELANGYHELIDPKEQRRRLEEANKKRSALGKNLLPLDLRFLEALEKGLPDCCGVAAGFDRLMLLRQGKKELAEVLPFAWHES